MKKQNFLTTKFVNGKNLQDFLETEKNTYTTFILQKQSKQATIKLLINKEMHHIQPLYAQKCDEDWNKIILSYDDHTKAHQLLFECYGNKYDQAVFLMRQQKGAEAMQAIRIQNVENARKNKTGRFNSELQSQLGSKPKKKRKLHSKSVFVTAALNKGTIWSHLDGTVLTLKGQKSVINVAEALFSKCSDSLKEGFLNNPNKSYLYTGTIRLLSGWFCKKTQRRTYNVGPWRLVGVLIDDVPTQNEIILTQIQ